MSVSPLWIKICAVIPSLHYRKLQGRTKALESNVQFIVGSVRATIGFRNNSKHLSRV